jgi:glutamate/tyrosine decarboxylase-like PLP-dependent enzyme
VKAGFDVREHGLAGGSPQLRVYASTETHQWAVKACELLGLGRKALRRIPVDSEYRIEIAQLEAAIAEDRRNGLRPICVIGNAGTVNTGATDDLRALAALCRKEGLWFHVDGAFGALAAIAPSLRSIVAGIEEADSLAFDLHKWGYVPYEVGCTLVRDAAAHKGAFATKAAYLSEVERGIAVDPLHFADLGIQLSRGFRALKVWFSLKVQGVAAWARLIEQNVAHARHLAHTIQETPELELMAPVPLNVVCFRFRPARVAEPALDALNRELLLRLQERGIAVPSSTMLGGRFAIRVANTNHRSRREDFDELVKHVLAIGAEIVAEGIRG